MPSHRKPMLFIVIALTLLLTLEAGAPAQSPNDPLAQGLKQRLDSAKPRTWWHWTSSNVTKDGITKDLEWMKRVGIAGFQLADVNAGGGQTVDKKIVFGTPEWFDAVRHAASEADRLGLEMTIWKLIKCQPPNSQSCIRLAIVCTLAGTGPSRPTGISS